MKQCANCHQNLGEQDLFCPNCGTKAEDVSAPVTTTEDDHSSSEFEPTVQNVTNPQDAVTSDNGNSFVNSVRQDLKNSRSLDMIRNKARTTSEKIKNTDAVKKKKIKRISIIAALVVIVILFATNIHKCEECEKTYFGKEYTIGFWGNTEKVCKECFNDFYALW